MRDQDKTKKHLIDELVKLRRRNAELEESEHRSRERTARLCERKNIFHI